MGSEWVRRWRRHGYMEEWLREWLGKEVIRKMDERMGE